MMWMFKFIFVLFIGSKVVGQCTWPGEFRSSTWRDSARGELVFGETTMTGWAFTIDSQTRNQWKCVVASQFESEGYLVMRSVDNFILFVTSRYYAYLCLKMTKITDVSYRYYIEEPRQPNLQQERFLVHTNGALDSTTSTCYPSFGATGGEYQVMILSGNEGAAVVNCPWIFLGKFDYTHTDVTGTSTCTSGGNTWDVCTDISQMAFDFNTCPTDVPFSVFGCSEES